MLSELIRNLGIYLLLFTPLEKLRPLHRQLATLKRPEFLTDLGHYFLTQAIAITMLGAVEGLLTEGTYQLGVTRPTGLCISWPWWLQLSFMILSNEAVAYFFHRASHSIPFVWKFHAIHHSSIQLDWLAAVRFHPLEIVMSRGLKFIPLALLGFSFAPFGLFLFFDTLQGYFIHANIRLRLRWLNWLIVTPQLHHWHHSTQVTHKNFGGLVPWLDLLFGTFYLPAPALSKSEIKAARAISPGTVVTNPDQEWPEAYGTSEPVGKSYSEQLLYPFTYHFTLMSNRKE